MRTTLEKKLRLGLRVLGVPRHGSILVGVSGGADSTALADALTREHDGETIIAHLNHLLRGDESDGDARFVETFAERLGLKCISERVDVAREAQLSGHNVEAVAREARYRFLARAAGECGSPFVATAHTRDDQVETVCMRLLRGTGPEGLRGIHTQRPLEVGVSVIRPILDVSRAEVIEHCKLRKLDYRTDSSNLEGELVRNRVRHELLPHLRSFNPRLDEALLRVAALVAEDDELLNLQAAAAVEEATGTAGQLKLPTLREMHPALRRRVLRLWLREGRGDLRRIDAVHVAAIERLMAKSEGGRRVELPGGFCVTRRLQTLVLEKTNRVGPEVGVVGQGNPERIEKK